MDPYGTFYIIHPDEKFLDRNINGEIIGLSEDSYGVTLVENPPFSSDSSKIISTKIKSFLELLVKKLFLFQSDNSYIKTEFGINVSNIKANMTDYLTEDIISYLYSRAYGVSDDMIKLISMNYATDKSVKKLSKFGDGFTYIRNVFSNCSSDSEALIKIADLIMSFLNKNGMNIVIEDDNMLTNEQLQNLSNIKINYLDNNKNRYFKNIDAKYVKTFMILDHSGKLENDRKLSGSEINEILITDAQNNLVFQKLKDNQHLINDWCDRNKINPECVSNYVRQYVLLQNKLIKYDYNILDREQINKVSFKWFDEKLNVDLTYSSNNRFMGIIQSLLHGYSTNIVKRIKSSNIYLKATYPDPQFVYSIETITNRSADFNSFISNSCSTDYLLYLKKDQKDQISQINKISPKLIQDTIQFILCPSNIKNNEKYDYIENEKIINALIKRLDPENNIKLTSELSTNFKDTIREIKSDMINNFNSSIYYSIGSLVKNNMRNDHNIFIEKFIKSQTDSDYKKDDVFCIKLLDQKGGKKYSRHKNYCNEYHKYILKKLGFC